MEKTGKAYGFLQWDVPKKELDEEIQASLIATESPSGLELKLDTIEEFDSPEGLKEITEEQKSTGKNYVITALYKDKTNAQAFGHLGQAITDLYKSPLNKPGNLFEYETFWEKD